MKVQGEYGVLSQENMELFYSVTADRLRRYCRVTSHHSISRSLELSILFASVLCTLVLGFSKHDDGTLVHDAHASVYMSRYNHMGCESFQQSYSYSICPNWQQRKARITPSTTLTPCYWLHPLFRLNRSITHIRTILRIHHRERLWHVRLHQLGSFVSISETRRSSTIPTPNISSTLPVSPNMNQLTLVHKEHEQVHYNRISYPMFAVPPLPSHQRYNLCPEVSPSDSRDLYYEAGTVS